MNSQSLNRRVDFERRAAGGSSTPRTWTPVATGVWASIRPFRAKEAPAADTVVATVSHTIMVRWAADLALPVITAHWRICHADKTGAARRFAIVGPGRDLQDEGRWLIFDCLEGATDGY